MIFKYLNYSNQGKNVTKGPMNGDASYHKCCITKSNYWVVKTNNKEVIKEVAENK